MKLPERKGIVKPEWADELEQGLELLWDGVLPRNDVVVNVICSTIHSDSLMDEIHSRIPGYTFFSDWYCDKIDMYCPAIEIQAARKAWMLDMIEEFRGPCKSST